MDDVLGAAVASQLGQKVPGLALVAATADDVVLAESWGLADISAGLPMKPETACNWFSMTKLVS